MENFLKLKTSLDKTQAVLAAHKIALWEYNILEDKIFLPENYFQSLGLKELGISFTTIEEAYAFTHPEDKLSINPQSFRERIKLLDKCPHIRMRIVAPTGQTVWIEEHFFSVISFNEQGDPERLMFYSENVSSRFEKETTIQRLEDRNQKIIEAIPEFIFIFDRHFFITDVLKSKGTILLHSVDELKGSDGRNFYSPSVSELFIHNIRECLADGEIKEIEYALDVEGHERRYFQARIAPYEENTVLALIHDIGDRVQRAAELLEAKQKAEESDKTKSLFLASMSHEIRTPLNAITGFAEMISLTNDPDERNEYLGIIQQNSHLLLQLINDILDLSRIESGKSEMNIQATEMRGLMEEIEKVHLLKMKPHILLHADLPSHKVWTLTDRNRIMQVMFNFLSNALKNTEKGTITLGLSEEKDWLVLYVTDTGCGIPKDKLPKIFTHFEKLNKFVQGTGLGLSICKSIADCLGGKIEVKSEVGVGSTFSLYIPSHVVRKDQQIENAQTLPIKSTQNTGKKILVAEDIESSFIQINTFLGANHTVSWVRNGEEVIRSFLRERPDLILMDIRMPIMDGVEATKRIRAMSTEIPIIAVTAQSFYIEQQQALAAGCNDILAKPFTMDQILSLVGKYLSC